LCAEHLDCNKFEVIFKVDPYYTNWDAFSGSGSEYVDVGHPVEQVCLPFGDFFESDGEGVSGELTCIGYDLTAKARTAAVTASVTTLFPAQNSSRWWQDRLYSGIKELTLSSQPFDPAVALHFESEKLQDVSVIVTADLAYVDSTGSSAGRLASLTVNTVDFIGLPRNDTRFPTKALVVKTKFKNEDLTRFHYGDLLNLTLPFDDYNRARSQINSAVPHLRIVGWPPKDREWKLSGLVISASGLEIYEILRDWTNGVMKNTNSSRIERSLEGMQSLRVDFSIAESDLNGTSFLGPNTLLNVSYYLSNLPLCNYNELTRNWQLRLANGTLKRDYYVAVSSPVVRLNLNDGWVFAGTSPVTVDLTGRQAALVVNGAANVGVNFLLGLPLATRTYSFNSGSRTELETFGRVNLFIGNDIPNKKINFTGYIDATLNGLYLEERSEGLQTVIANLTVAGDKFEHHCYSENSSRPQCSELIVEDITITGSDANLSTSDTGAISFPGRVTVDGSVVSVHVDTLPDPPKEIRFVYRYGESPRSKWLFEPKDRDSGNEETVVDAPGNITFVLIDEKRKSAADMLVRRNASALGRWNSTLLDESDILRGDDRWIDLVCAQPGIRFNCTDWKERAGGWEVSSKYGDVTWTAPEYRCTQQVIGYFRGAAVEQGKFEYRTCLQARPRWSGGDPFTPHGELAGSSSSGAEEAGMAVGAMIGIIIGCIVVAAIIALVVVAFLTKKLCFGGDSSSEQP
jgi:hypothetical protein